MARATNAQGLGQGVIASLGYSCCSISMVILNKAVLSTYGYNHHFALLLYQTSLSFGCLMLWKRLGWTELEPFNMDLAVKWFPVNLFFLAMLFSSYLSIKLLAVPMVTIFKNCANVITLAGDWYFFNQRISGGVMGSLALMVAGAVFSGLSDVSFSAEGYLWMLINCCTTAGYLLYMRRVMQNTPRMGKFQTAYYNSLLGIPVISVAAVVLGDLPAALWAPQMSSLGFIAAATVSGAIGFFLQLASLWCISATSPSTYSMVGAFNKVPVAILGVVLFDNPVTLKLAVFIAMGICGGILFSYIKSQEALQEQEEKAAQEAAKAKAAEAARLRADSGARPV